MAEERPSGEKGKRKSWKDIGPILNGWDYEPGAINVRKITGRDGLPKVQMRLDLGLLQMEMDGRPDGSRPFGCESLLEYHEKRLREYRRKNGSSEGFRLTATQCQSLREEASMYYQRYLSLFVLGEYAAVARDTARNLKVLDLCGRYGAHEQDRLLLEQYRPYILMMNGRAHASLEIDAGNLAGALRIVKRALREIRAFFRRFGQEDAYRHASEARLLRRFGREIQKKLPVDPVRQLQRALDRAVKEERYEEAARLRDQLEKLKPGLQG